MPTSIFQRDIRKLKKKNWKKKYSDHVNSKEWRMTRAYIKSQRRVCELCNSRSKKFNLHHLTYAVLYKEKNYWAHKYLMILCLKCHNKVHNSKLDKYKLLDPKRNKDLYFHPNWRRWTRFYAKKKFFNQWWKFWV